MEMAGDSLEDGQVHCIHKIGGDEGSACSCGWLFTFFTFHIDITEMLPDTLTIKYGAHHPSTLYSATEREGDPWDPSTLVAPKSGTVGPYVKTKNTKKFHEVQPGATGICFYFFIFCYEKVAFLWVNNKEEEIKRGILNTNEGILVLIRSKNACAAHVFEFPLAEMEWPNWNFL